MMSTRFIAAASLAGLLMAGAAQAQTPPAPAPAPAASPAPATPMKAGKARTAQSLACSADADKQSLHGKPRKTFMRKCKSGKA